jgi:hypothetical protein
MPENAEVINSKVPGSTQASAPDHSLWMLAKVLFEIASENVDRDEVSVPRKQRQHGHQHSNGKGGK